MKTAQEWDDLGDECSHEGVDMSPACDSCRIERIRQIQADTLRWALGNIRFQYATDRGLIEIKKRELEAGDAT